MAFLAVSSVMEDLSRANSLFALDLYRALSESNAEENMFFSPLSISAALSMVYLGARGETSDEMAKVWGIYVTLEHKTSLKSMGYICSNSQKYIVWVKMYIPFCKYIKTYFLLIICIAKNFKGDLCIAKNFKWDFNLDFFAPSDSRFSNSCISAKYGPILTKHTMESLFIQLSGVTYTYISIFQKLTLMTCGPVSQIRYHWCY